MELVFDPGFEGRVGAGWEPCLGQSRNWIRGMIPGMEITRVSRS